MDIKEFVKLFRQCEEETREQRKIDEKLTDGNVGYFKLSIYDFVEWLEKTKCYVNGCVILSDGTHTKKHK